MPRLTRRVRRCATAVAATAAASFAALAPITHAAAEPQRQSATVHHANLLSAIADLPHYYPGVVHWHLSTSWKHYGTTNWDTNTITISAFTPLTLLYSVVAHEWGHEVQAYDYHGDLWAGVKAMNRHFGGAGKSGQRGIEYAADCMAILQGATWTDYTPCRHKAWRSSARRLLEGHKLKKLPRRTMSTSSTATSDTATSTTPGAVTYGTPPEPDQ
ncbi:MAG TPA: hypothetical protein VHV76_16550 [Mycobacteriales bacterium]|nr:hypothetical protein [Mycobacteriales bacterium]